MRNSKEEKNELKEKYDEFVKSLEGLDEAALRELEGFQGRCTGHNPEEGFWHYLPQDYR